jgi:hypothetical protein
MLIAAILAVIFGLPTAFIGLLSSFDPEGRGSLLAIALPAGGLLSILGVGYLGFRGFVALASAFVG